MDGKRDIAFNRWNYADVRLLDPVDTANPEQDLISVYARNNSQFFQIRLDFLDLENPDGRDIYIPIDTNPGGVNWLKIGNSENQYIQIDWDYLLIFQADGDIKLVSGDYHVLNNVELLIFIDSIQDNIIFSINQEVIPLTPLAKLQVLIYPPHQDQPADQTLIISLDSSPPPQTKIQFVFWNTLETTTPAEAMRSWAGAHSGPMSSRHGLMYLLEAISKFDYPVLIVDLCKPENASVIDYFDVNNIINNLSDRNILALCNKVNIESKELVDIDKNQIKILSNYDYTHYYNSETNNFLFTENLSISKDTFRDSFMEFKSYAISSGVSGSPMPLLLGGDFRISYLGDRAVLDKLFSYINNHPWIKVDNTYAINQGSLNHDISRSTYIFNQSKFSTGHSIYKALLDAPDNSISVLAWQVYSSLLNPLSEDMVPLANNYVGQIGHILEASHWAENPISISSCSMDLDYDGINECVLASKSIFLTIEPIGGYIPFIFSVDQNGPHQIVGPTWEFVIGLSDISEWDLSKGVNSDPNQILGAFYDKDEKWDSPTISNGYNEIEIQNNDMSIRKTFSIQGNIIKINSENRGNHDNTIQIPLVLDPWFRFTEEWGGKYITSLKFGSINWGITSGISVDLLSDNDFALYSFNATRDIIKKPENPNYDYGRGHYLPFPMALAEAHEIGGSEVEIIIHP